MPARPLRFDAPVLHAIEACHVCAEACILCADTSLDEAAASLARCIRLALDCAEACSTTGAAMAQRTPANGALLRPMAETCAALCEACAAECDLHVDEHDHCRLCAEACRACARACRAAAMSLGPNGLLPGK
ncbi:four-helix bundle copper-binding protein [Reyranella aquatilis]|uniref:Four-helix bundle copper-binding protein n=1 Tax=Reyranella aquatilis TaxID=2035356 RepID=A0ABS8L0U8_9HYPH|nr:four-helix bundle copper-binding protein [Reyranella aquatilis]MCC8431965.1 four-helix bundle copper-binding protein [Reyranella aquatilis]